MVKFMFGDLIYIDEETVTTVVVMVGDEEENC